jgi:hypothetical protein
VAFSAGATDEISHSMGQQRTQLGMNVVGTALPADADSSATPEDVVLYFGIIDILQVCKLGGLRSHQLTGRRKWGMGSCLSLLLCVELLRNQFC